MLHNQTSYSKRSSSLWERIVNGMDFALMFSLVFIVCLATPAAAQTTPSIRLTPLRTAQTQTTPSFSRIPLRAGQTTPSFPQTPPSATQITPSSGQTTPSAGPATPSTTPSSACGNTSYYGPSGFIRSPNYPGIYYNNLDCNYSIYGSNESSLWLVFESFGTESCCDIVTISCPGDPSFPIQRFSGSSLPDPVWISRCSLGLVNFRTDGSRVASGFSLSYNVTVEASTACGDTSYYGPSGVISSPNYPGNYYNDLNCSYYIYAATGNSLTFTFKSFDVEEGYDYVTISCATNSSFSPQRYTGNSLPEAVSVPWCSRGLVNFRTDNSTVSGGFSLNYYVSVGGCGNTVYTGFNGYVTSTNYPSNYGFYQNCSSIIWAPQRSTFYLSFESLFLYGCCNCDWLEISCIDNSDYGPYRFCGQYIGASNLYIYGCSQVLLWFHSDGSVSQGFKTLYTVYAESESMTTAVPPGSTQTTYYPPTSTTLEPACHYDYIFESSGVISSPNYPGNYYNSLSCYYYIYATPGSTIAFIFEDFHVQDSADYVRIDCPSNSNFPVQQYSGQTIPLPLSIVLCSRANLYFYTDSSIVYSGFNIKYYVSEGDCGHTVHNESFGQVISPNYPSNYSYYQNCSHIIWAPQRSHFHLNFLFFELQDCATCGGDWVEISCLDNNPSNKRRFCGSTAYSLDYYQCTQVFVWFHSDGPYNDGTSNYKGFNLEYNVYPELETTSVQDATGSSQTTSTQSLPASTLLPGCDEFHCGPSGTITSPNYPDNYHDSLRCNYIIQGSTDSFITIIFDHFDMQDDKDYVTIRCETNSSFPEQTYSGHTLPPPLTIPWCSQASVYFNSDKDTVYSGFSIDYYVNDAGCGNTVYTGSVGNVTSPNYPAYYSYYENCSNIIWAPQRSHFHLSFQSVATQSLCELCSCDFIEISCLDNNPSYKHRLCDEANRIFDFYQCTQVLVWFHSDDTSNDPFDLGFLLNYNVYPDAGCNEASYYGPSGVIRSPNYPGSYYDALYCDYNIYTSSLSGSIAIIFKAFNTEDCCDYLTVSCPTNSSYSPVTYSGSSLPQPISIPWCSQGRVNFNTDSSVISTGFNLDYHVSLGGCGETVYTGVQGYVSSPNYPNNYGDNQNCSNIIWAYKPTSFDISFLYINLEECCDFVELSCLDNPSYGNHRFTGDFIPPTQTIPQCTQVLVWFFTDDSNVFGGFNLEYSVTPGSDDRNMLDKDPSNGKPNAAEKDPNNEKPNESEKEPNSGKRNAAEKKFSNGKPNALEK